MDIVGDERRWEEKVLSLSFCAFMYSCNLQTFHTYYNSLWNKQSKFYLAPFEIEKIEA